MSHVSEVEYRVARENYRLRMAANAKSEEVASRHRELARRYGDYDYRVIDIEHPASHAA